jgi:hypothetical protein
VARVSTSQNGGVPAGMEVLAARRMSPEFNLPYGFLNEAEAADFNFLQAGWTHSFTGRPDAGVLQVRYGFSIAHLNTKPASQVVSDQSRVELFGSANSGAPPLENRAIRTRQEIAAAWQPDVLRGRVGRDQITAGGGWEISSPQNSFNVPSDLNLITANGAPAFVVEFNSPARTRETLRSFSGYLTDHLVFASTLSLDVGALLDVCRGSLPAQPSLIAWNNISPQVGFAWQVAHAHRFVVRGLYTRLYTPLAGRYLDFGNPNGLGGNEYQWIDRNSDGRLEPGEQGTLLMRFGGPYSSISLALKRPYADEFNIGAEFRIAGRSIAGVHVFRRDEKDRLAAIDTGVPPQAFTPVSILDPGPDGITGTFDDRFLTVYQQDPATFGQDRYLLTNPPGLRALNTGLLAEVRTSWRSLMFHASLVAEKSWGPANTGNAVFENDPGVLGALFLDPNTAIHATGRNFTDRAYVGKLQAVYHFHSRWAAWKWRAWPTYSRAKELAQDGYQQPSEAAVVEKFSVACSDPVSMLDRSGA